MITVTIRNNSVKDLYHQSSDIFARIHFQIAKASTIDIMDESLGTIEEELENLTVSSGKVYLVITTRSTKRQYIFYSTKKLKSSKWEIHCTGTNV